MSKTAEDFYEEEFQWWTETERKSTLKIMESYASQQVQEYKEKLKTALMNEFYKKSADEIYDLIDKL